LRDGVLTLSDANGKPIDGVKPEALADGVNPKSISRDSDGMRAERVQPAARLSAAWRGLGEHTTRWAGQPTVKNLRQSFSAAFERAYRLLAILCSRNCAQPLGSGANEGKTMKLISRFWRDESGATAIEYGLIAAGISIAIIVAVNGLGTNLNNMFTSVNNSLK
jgi:pilus assembly protein Flp/PilA